MGVGGGEGEEQGRGRNRGGGGAEERVQVARIRHHDKTCLYTMAHSCFTSIYSN